MESAIPEHLRCPRSRERRIAPDYRPPFPAWTARAAASVRQVVMAYFGVQFFGQDMSGKARAALAQIVEGFARTDGPGHHDLAHHVDADGYDNYVAIAYWDDPETFHRWRGDPAIDLWWSSDERLSDGLGYYREILMPKVERFETLFSSPDRLEGVGVVMGTRSVEDIQEHGYWGGARDRLSAAQTDALTSSDPSILSRSTSGKRVFITGHDNLALIRSGQEWTETEGLERKLYIVEMEPVLREGMDYLRDHGAAIGCYNNRYMRHMGIDGRIADKSFGLSYWRSLGDLEHWAELHPTHVAIFGTFMRIVKELHFNLNLRLYHEVIVVNASEQSYEYTNCHIGTGVFVNDK